MDAAAADARRRPTNWAVPTAIFVLLFGGGIAVGWCFGGLNTRRAVDDALGRATLGAFVDSDERAAYASAYLDAAAAAVEMDDYAWTVPVVPVPFVGHAPAPGRHANAQISAQLFRRAGDLAVPPPAGVRRVFVTGGSTAFGSGAPAQERTIAGYLEALLTAELSPETGLRYEVVNAATPGWTTTHERLWIQHWITRFAPDLVVSLSGNNDVHWGLLGRGARMLRVAGDAHFHSLIGLAYASAGRPLRDVLPKVAGRLPVADVAKTLAGNADLVSHALRGVPYVFALQPTLPATDKGLSERERARLARLEQRRDGGAQEYFRAGYREIATALGALARRDPDFDFVDLSGIFDRLGPDTELFLDSYHFGDRGNAQIAGALFAALRARIAALPESPRAAAVPAR